MAKKEQIPQDNNIINIPLEEAMPDNYLPYAVEVAKDRALPDVRDGMKPVHRRILYGAYLLKAFPDRAHMKSARIVGDILGKFHPHGDASVYDAMVILAQDFTTRVPLVDGHGNWGSIDGDNAAAMRYTEARLSTAAMEMLRDIDKDTVDFGWNYADTEQEPTVLPARYPNLLVNGAFGIAVGLATNIPPHNLGEVAEAVSAYMENPDLSVAELMHHVKGPDFPTGGVLIGGDSLVEAYEKGEGRVILRAKAQVEKLSTGRFGIVITEFPYRKNKARLLMQISAMTADKRHQRALDGIFDIRDESDREGIRAVIEFKRGVDEETAQKILLYLYKRCDLQININFNMVALAGGKPETLGLKDLIRHYVDHQKDVVLRRTRKELEMAQKRYHIVEGFMKAIDIMDAVIATIRRSGSKAEAGKNLVEGFAFTEPQATAILELMLYRLTGLELKAYIKEHGELTRLIGKLHRIIDSEKELIRIVRKELLEVASVHGNPRRTRLIADEEEAVIEVEDILVEEDVVVVLSKDGFIKRMPRKNYQRVSSDVSAIEYREGDRAVAILPSNTKETLYIFTSRGTLCKVRTLEVPEHKWKDKGVRLDNLVRSLDLSEEEVVTAFGLGNQGLEGAVLKLLTSKGRMKRTPLSEFESRVSRIAALKLQEEERLLAVVLERGRLLYDHTLGGLLPAEYKTFLEEEREAESVLPEAPCFLRVLTKKGLDYTIPEAEVLTKDRMVNPDAFTVLPDLDEIYRVHYQTDYEVKAFHLVVTPAGEIRVTSRLSRARNLLKIQGESTLDLLLVTNLGAFYKMPMYMFENMEEPVKLSDLYGDFGAKERVVGIFSMESALEETRELYVVTEEGMVKRTALTEFAAEQSSAHVVRFKSATDRLVYAEAFPGALDEALLLVTERGMALRIETGTIPVLSRNAGGVVGIALREEDRLFFAKVITDETEIIAGSKANDDIRMRIEDIKLQNRATRGRSIITVVMDDLVNKVEIN